MCKVKVVSLARKVLILGGSSSWVLFTEERERRWERSTLLYCNRQQVRQLTSPPGWYFSVYPRRRPLRCKGGPHSRVRESKLRFMVFRKGGPGTGEQHHKSSQERDTFWGYLVDSLVATVDAALQRFLLTSSNQTAALISAHLLQESQICCFDSEGLLLYY